MTALERLPYDSARFPYSWRIEDERWDKLPPEIMGQLSVFSESTVVALHEMVSAFREPGPFVPKEGKLKIASRCSLVEEHIDDSARIQHWFATLPIPCHESVYVHWSNQQDAALAMTWSLFRAIWNSLWYPFSSVEVFDDSLEWAVLLGQEEEAWFMAQ